VKGRKRHALVDTEGWLIRVICLPADIQDWDAAEDLFLVAKRACPRLRLVWADSVYGYAGLPEWAEAELGWRVEVVRKRDGQRGFEALPRRWVVERTFAWLLRNRRLSKDYEELPETTEAWCYAAMLRPMLRSLTAQAA
jgi:putative transposase